MYKMDGKVPSLRIITSAAMSGITHFIIIDEVKLVLTKVKIAVVVLYAWFSNFKHCPTENNQIILGM